MRAKLREIAQAAQTDPKQALIDSVGDLSGFEPFHSLVLVATYIQPEKTKGGIILADRSLAEDRFQGKVGLVIKIGPLAFKDDQINKFGGVMIEELDWVMYRASDGMEMFFVDETGRNGTPCRLVEDVNIKARISHPAMIY